MFRDDAGQNDWLFATVVGGLVIAACVVIHSVRSSAPRKIEAVVTMPSPSAPQPASQRQIMAKTEPMLVTRTPPAIAHVYECSINGHLVLSDHPCGTDMTIRTIAAPNRADAQDTSILYRSSPRPIERRESRSGGSAVISNKRVCDSIEDQIDRINARMRQLYTSQEGERFRERLRRLSESRWEVGCGR